MRSLLLFVLLACGDDDTSGPVYQVPVVSCCPAPGWCAAAYWTQDPERGLVVDCDGVAHVGWVDATE